MLIQWIAIHLLCITIVLNAQETYTVFNYQPQQIHIAYGENANDIVVTWSTMTNVGENGSIVEYGVYGFNEKAYGTTEKFVDGGPAKRAQYIHRVTLKGLKPKTRYIYHCGCKKGWSSLFSFNVPQIDSDWSPHVAIFGDMGNENSRALPLLQAEAQLGMYDAMIHDGDLAYDMHTENALVGDQFMRQIEPIAAYVPYMVAEGNHEYHYNFSNYRTRFSMPGGTQSIMYSFNLGPVHFIGFSTELYYYMEFGIQQMINQYEWLENDLIEANKPENRKARPWIITYGHRPMYCSNEDITDCTHSETLVRVGMPFTHLFSLEKLFYKYGVDVEIFGHEHSYERSWPLYDYKVKNGSFEHPYTNPRASVHIVTGAAGNKENLTKFLKKLPNWTAFQSEDYSYTRMKAYNSTHLYFEQMSVSKREVIDRFYIIKDHHKPYEGANEM